MILRPMRGARPRFPLRRRRFDARRFAVGSNAKTCVVAPSSPFAIKPRASMPTKHARCAYLRSSIAPGEDRLRAAIYTVRREWLRFCAAPTYDRTVSADDAMQQMPSTCSSSVERKVGFLFFFYDAKYGQTYMSCRLFQMMIAETFLGACQTLYTGSRCCCARELHEEAIIFWLAIDAACWRAATPPRLLADFFDMRVHFTAITAARAAMF